MTTVHLFTHSLIYFIHIVDKVFIFYIIFYQLHPVATQFIGVVRGLLACLSSLVDTDNMCVSFTHPIFITVIHFCTPRFTDFYFAHTFPSFLLCTRLAELSNCSTTAPHKTKPLNAPQLLLHISLSCDRRILLCSQAVAIIIIIQPIFIVTIHIHSPHRTASSLH